MESLNLLRYLLINEREISVRFFIQQFIKTLYLYFHHVLLIRPTTCYFQTGIWIDLRHIAESYTKLLRVCLSMSKSYYGKELKRLREDKKIKAKGNTCFVFFLS